MLADDHPVNRALATGLLTKLGHSVTVAPDGRQALDAFAASSFDLVFMDVQMPENGWV